MKVLIVGMLTLRMLSGSGAAAHAQTPRAQRNVAAEGRTAWGGDGWAYVVQQGRWMRTAFSRRVPVAGDPRIFDVYQNGVYLKRVDLRQPGWVFELDAAAQNAEYTWRRVRQAGCSRCELVRAIERSCVPTASTRQLRDAARLMMRLAELPLPGEMAAR